jgi:UDP-glucose 4-epimerase
MHEKIGDDMSLTGKRILVLGGTGSLGQALIRRLGSKNDLIVFSRDEAKHWTIRNRLTSDYSVEFKVGDIRDRQRVRDVIRTTSPNIIILASALKQVDTCELTPSESIKTNILGIENVVEAVLLESGSKKSLETVLMVSTDKACAPTNVYGMSKAIAERVVTSASTRVSDIRFVGVRYGNVLESRGSIIPLFKMQCESNQDLTVTDKTMTRFIMTLDESTDLIEATILNASSGEIWLPKLKSMKILELAQIFSRRYGSQIRFTGIRPGEKLHEELVSEPESLRIKDSGKYMKLFPAYQQVVQTQDPFTFSSRDHLVTQHELEKYLESLGIFSREISTFPGLQIEEIPIGKKL